MLQCDRPRDFKLRYWATVESYFTISVEQWFLLKEKRFRLLSFLTDSISFRKVPSCIYSELSAR